MTFPSFRMLSLIFLLIRYLKSVRGSKQDGVVVNKFPDYVATPILDKFQPATVQEMSKIIQGTKVKSCQLDPLAAVVLKQALDILLPDLG